MENIVTKIGLELIAFPLIVTIYLARVDKITGNKWARWGYKNFAAYLLLLCIGLGVVMEILKSRHDPAAHPQDKPLVYLWTSDYIREVTSGPQATKVGSARDALQRKFEHTDYAWQKKDYDEVIRQLTQIKAGKDDAGTLPAISSFVVENDLACAFFMAERNKGFKASRCMQSALDMCEGNDPKHKDVESNFKVLDEMVNRLD